MKASRHASNCTFEKIRRIRRFFEINTIELIGINPLIAAFKLIQATVPELRVEPHGQGIHGEIQP
jgi:hypothetical protein